MKLRERILTKQFRKLTWFKGVDLDEEPWVVIMDDGGYDLPEIYGPYETESEALAALNKLAAEWAKRLRGGITREEYTLDDFGYIQQLNKE